MVKIWISLSLIRDALNYVAVAYQVSRRANSEHRTIRHSHAIN